MEQYFERCALVLFLVAAAIGAPAQTSGQDCNRKIPQPVKSTSPNFSDIPRTQPLRGVVKIGLTIDKDGNVKTAWIIQGLDKEIDKRALQAAEKSTWLPALKKCKAVESTINFEISLDLH